ncbi:MAG TPA: DUF4129 domain-containing protein [Candidatus Hydrogenedentes bacterium]|nr:DUF4129 domain-containing protein [Candidatus Hydrogenedentota bacterium]HPG69939.1 DUF4129 domain-containing protein [Candidatus Hydrogenedentota bacterium]
MRSPRNESVNDPFPQDLGPPDDLGPMSSTPVHARARKRKNAPTDFDSLAQGMQDSHRITQHRSGVDILVEGLTPTLIFVMVYMLVFFLLDIYEVMHPDVSQTMLRWVAFNFVMGIVALNRLVARDGTNESVMYIGGLGMAIALYTFSTPELYPISAFIYPNPYFATLFNVVLVSFLWWATNRLTHECCVDESPEAGDIGLLTSTARRFQKAVKRDPKFARERAEKNRPIFEIMEIEAVDPTETKIEKKKAPPRRPTVQRLPTRHPGISVLYFSALAMLAFALGYPVLAEKGRAAVMMGHFYVGAYTFAALMLLMLSSLAGLREYFRARHVFIPPSQGRFWLALGTAMVVIVLVVATQLPLPGLPETGDAPAFRGKVPHGFTEVLLSPGRAAAFFERSRVMTSVAYSVLVSLAVFAIYGLLKILSIAAGILGRRRDLLPSPMRRFFSGLDRFLQAITKLPTIPKATFHTRVPRKLAMSTAFRNPMKGASDSGKRTTAGYIEYAYAALCALAHDLGVPRGDGETPYEFLRRLPKPLESLTDEALELTQLYVRSAYSDAPPDAGVEDRLRKFWIQYERVRHRIVR